MTSLDKIEQAPAGDGSVRPSPRHRADRDAQARGADRADAARADRDDDHRSGPGRTARRRGRGRRGAGEFGVLHHLHLRHGAGVGGGAAGGAGVRRPQSADGAARAARRAVGGAADFPAVDGPAALRRADPAVAGSGAGDRASRAGISARPGVGHCAGALVPRHPRLHGRGEPAGAGLVDHAGGDPGQCACWSIC